MTSREHLRHLLAEASELEHNILCCYLYAVFSLKQDESEDLSCAELAAVARWRKDLLGLCIEEMLHLAQVANLTVAIGARPHFNRPNLPVAPGYHPAGVVLKLAPFDLETLEHFIYLERPEEAKVADSEAFEEGQGPERTPAPDTLMPRAPEYETIGEFYAALREALADAAGSMGEAALFCGPLEQQLRASELNAPELSVVVDVASATRAIDLIVVQGEGSGSRTGDSHFGRFEDILDEYRQLLAARPGFVAHRAVARNPVMHAPVADDRVHVTHETAAAVLDAANAAYSAMLRLLARCYEIPWTATDEREATLSAAMACMKAVTGLGTALTHLPATQDGSGPRAGMTFAMLRSTEGFFGANAAPAMADRLDGIAAGVCKLAIGDELARSLATALSQRAAGLRRAGERRTR
jgi:hypothetical protein